MSTKITIDANGFIALKQQADKVAQLNQESAAKKAEAQKLTKAQRLEQSRKKFGALADRFRANRNKRTSDQEQTNTDQSNAIVGSLQPIDSSGKKRNSVPSTELVRELSAQRDTNVLVPFALSWRGAVQGRTPTVYTVKLIPDPSPDYVIPPSIFTYTGGNYLPDTKFEVSSSASIVQIDQPARYSEWNTKAKIALFDFYGPEWTYEGFWAEQLRSTEFPGAQTWALPTAPGNLSPVGPFSHSAEGLFLAVSSDGTIFVTVALPYPATPTSSVQTPSEAPPITTFYRDVYYAGFYEPYKLGGLQQYVTVNGVNLYNGLPLGSFNQYPSIPLEKFAKIRPYLFMKVKDGKIEQKTAPFDENTDFDEFYKSNAFTDDPGKNLRSTYPGEVRIRGNQANKLRMRFEEVIDDVTYVNYQDFPFVSLTGFVEGTGASAKLKSGVTFENHIYNLAPYTTDEQLASQLAAIVNPTAYQDQPEFLPDRIVKLQLSPSFIAAAAKKINTAGPDVLTPLTYFVAMP